MNTRKGFTLIELLVVIAIIGILSSVVLASLNSARTKSRDAKRVSDIKQLQLALELYFDSNGAYPTTTAALAPAHIATIPVDPVGTNVAYPYSALTNGTGTVCTSYHLRATLEDATHAALDGDADAAVGTACAGNVTADAAGTDPIYDVKP